MPALCCSKFESSDTPLLILKPKVGSQSPRQDYVYQLVALILAKSNDKFGKCEVSLLDPKLSLKRSELYLERGQLVDALALTVTKARDQRFLAVTIPISKGLIGYRLFVIRKGQNHVFSAVKSIRDLSEYTAGQGNGWADTDILRHNGLPVITSSSIKNLIRMLVNKRFDYFPSGVLQIARAISSYKALDVELEKNLVLAYPSMTALYVNADNKALAARLQYGLNKAYQDGSFDTFFNTHPTSVAALKNLNLDVRTSLKLCNSVLPSWVPINDPKYWLEPWSQRIINNQCTVE